MEQQSWPLVQRRYKGRHMYSSQQQTLQNNNTKFVIIVKASKTKQTRAGSLQSKIDLLRQAFYSSLDFLVETQLIKQLLVQINII